jgi:hypothetical protein
VGLGLEEANGLLYPIYTYIHCTQGGKNPLLNSIFDVVGKNGHVVRDIRNTPYRKSIDVERVLADDLGALGFLHSATNKKVEHLFREGVNFEVDFFHPQMHIAIEIEKGEINNVWRNVIKFAESTMICHGVLMVPVIRHEGTEKQSDFYNNTLKKLDNMERIYSLMDTLAIIGY